jgi:hypothetical protein
LRDIESAPAIDAAVPMERIVQPHHAPRFYAGSRRRRCIAISSPSSAFMACSTLSASGPRSSASAWHPRAARAVPGVLRQGAGRRHGVVCGIVAPRRSRATRGMLTA